MFKAIDVINCLLNEINKRQIIIHPSSLEEIENFNILVRAWKRVQEDQYNNEQALNKMLEDLSLN